MLEQWVIDHYFFVSQILCHVFHINFSKNHYILKIQLYIS